MVIWVTVTVLYNSSVYFCCLFLISSASIRSLLFLSFIAPFLAWSVPLISPVLLKSLVFPILLFSSTSLHCSFQAFLSLLAILWNSLFSWVYLSLSAFLFAFLFSLAMCKAYSDNHFALLHLFFFGDSFVTDSWIMLWNLSIVLQALCFLNLIPEPTHHLHCIIIRNLI